MAWISVYKWVKSSPHKPVCGVVLGTITSSKIVSELWLGPFRSLDYGEWWNGVRWKHVPLFGFVKKEWDRMACDGTHSVQYHPFSHIFISQFEVYPKEWNTLIIQLQLWPCLFHQLCCIVKLLSFISEFLCMFSNRWFWLCIYFFKYTKLFSRTHAHQHRCRCMTWCVIDTLDF